ncbi:MAG: urea carboxylase, partial [Bryobacterales bacterium]|nr:urea carboxylase [Bryobacterales bacterium]
ELDGEPVERWRPIAVSAGSVLRLHTVSGAGSRGYIAVRGGIDVPDYLGSKSTFILGKFGGHAGRTLRAGDLLRFGPGDAPGEPQACADPPKYGNHWEIGVQYGPHGAPDFFTERDRETLFSTDWTVHYNSDRTGVRLIGPKPEWARKDGGEAGLHPSNIHDNAYAIGAVDFTGDMPIILGPDGPSLGGFVCPATIVHDELWKIGQVRAGDTIRLQRVDNEPATLRRNGASIVRASGDRNLLIEFGPNRLDFALRLRAHAVMQWFERNPVAGIIDLTPGIRSLQIHYDGARVSRDALLDALATAEREQESVEDMAVPSRVVHLPLSWDDPATQLAIEKYTRSVRPDAPWCPSNIEFIRRMNGLDSIDAVHRIVFDASYLVLGLGDVYLGAPVATPIDPRHRLVTTKYNPARTWTPENAVGIGGAYLCVYGMEGPGGYQFVGRTIQMWNRYKVTRDFVPGHPWLLRFFDQIRFYPVSAEELLHLRDDFAQGKFNVRIEPAQFRLREYNAFAESIRGESEAFKQKQQAAFEAERERWKAAGQAEYAGEAVSDAPVPTGEDGVPAGCEPVRGSVTANIWKVLAKLGEFVKQGQNLIILEAMKMEIVVTAPVSGHMVELRCAEGTLVTGGQIVAVIRTEE